LLQETWSSVAREETSERIVLDLNRWRALPISLQRSTVREAVRRLRRSLRDSSFVHVENAVVVARDGTTGDQSTLPQGLMLTVEYDQLVFGCADAPSVAPDWPLLPADCEALPVGAPGITPLPESVWRIEISAITREDLPYGWDSNSDPWRAFVDADAVGRELWMRTRQPGDLFHPLGMGGRTVKLSDFLTNRKVPRTVRDRLPLLVGEPGIVWVCGHRVDERARIRESTEEALLLRFVQREGNAAVEAGSSVDALS
jgi:tRNA(Ile)-lysidine synthase